MERGYQGNTSRLDALNSRAQKRVTTMKEARLYKKLNDKNVECLLCSHRCHIKNGHKGLCGVRENSDGTLRTLVYGSLIAEAIDPIEKKPFFHYLPGSSSYSVSTVGCNFRCLHCQNFNISQMPKSKEGNRIVGTPTTPEEIVEKVSASGCASIAYTYTEPTIFFEYAYDTARLAHKRGIKNLFVTNGFMTKECIAEMTGVIDAANVDIKAFTEDFYKKVCGARLAPVLKSIEYLRAAGIWVEVTTLIIPGYNDSEEELREIARWIASTDNSMPWHVSAFYPTYKLLDSSPTPPATLIRAREIGLEEGLRYVYTGNIPGMDGESTYCYSCKAQLIERFGFKIVKNRISEGRCPECKSPVDGLFT